MQVNMEGVVVGIVALVMIGVFHPLSSSVNITFPTESGRCF